MLVDNAAAVEDVLARQLLAVASSMGLNTFHQLVSTARRGDQG